MTAVHVGTVLGAFVRRDWVAIRSYRAPFVLQTVTTLLTLLVFLFLSQLVSLETVDGAARTSDYFSFVVVGLAVLRILQTSMSTFDSKLRDEQVAGTLEALLMTRTPASLVILASAGYDLLHGLALGAVTLLLAVAFGADLGLSALGALAVFATVAATMALFGAIGIALAAFTLVFKRSAPVAGLVGTTLGILGGVYFPIELLPGWLEAIARLIPFTWSVELLRAALLGGEVPWGLLALLALSGVVVIAAALRVFLLAVDRARAQGTLTQF